MAGFVERREQARIDLDPHRFRLTRREIDLDEADETLRRFPSARSRRSIDLPHGHSATLAGVAQCEMDGNAVW